MTTIIENHGFSSPEVARAYEDAVASVAKEHQAPEYIRMARRRALLRWLDTNGSATKS